LFYMVYTAPVDTIKRFMAEGYPPIHGIPQLLLTHVYCVTIMFLSIRNV
jgi:hypothetical protein